MLDLKEFKSPKKKLALILTLAGMVLAVVGNLPGFFNFSNLPAWISGVCDTFVSAFHDLLFPAVFALFLFGFDKTKNSKYLLPAFFALFALSNLSETLYRFALAIDWLFRKTGSYYSTVTLGEKIWGIISNLLLSLIFLVICAGFVVTLISLCKNGIKNKMFTAAALILSAAVGIASPVVVLVKGISNMINVYDYNVLDLLGDILRSFANVGAGLFFIGILLYVFKNDIEPIVLPKLKKKQ